MGSTGEVAVEKSLGLNTQDEALEFAVTTQAADLPNIPQPENVLVPPGSASQSVNQQPDIKNVQQ